MTDQVKDSIEASLGKSFEIDVKPSEPKAKKKLTTEEEAAAELKGVKVPGKIVSEVDTETCPLCGATKG